MATAVITYVFDALTLTNAFYFERAGVNDFRTSRYCRDYDWPEFIELDEYVRLSVDKAGNIEEAMEGGSDESKIQSLNFDSNYSKNRHVKFMIPEQTIVAANEELDETEQAEVVIPNLVIM